METPQETETEPSAALELANLYVAAFVASTPQRRARAFVAKLAATLRAEAERPVRLSPRAAARERVRRLAMAELARQLPELIALAEHCEE